VLFQAVLITVGMDTMTYVSRAPDRTEHFQ
jgi:hypothetical protein